MSHKVKIALGSSGAWAWWDLSCSCGWTGREDGSLAVAKRYADFHRTRAAGEDDRRISEQLAEMRALAAEEERPCDLCGEPADLEMGEFAEEDGRHLIAHAQCGLDAGLEMA